VGAESCCPQEANSAAVIKRRRYLIQLILATIKRRFSGRPVA
jgi:hypothetical protein